MELFVKGEEEPLGGERRLLSAEKVPLFMLPKDVTDKRMTSGGHGHLHEHDFEMESRVWLEDTWGGDPGVCHLNQCRLIQARGRGRAFCIDLVSVVRHGQFLGGRCVGEVAAVKFKACTTRKAYRELQAQPVNNSEHLRCAIGTMGCASRVRASPDLEHAGDGGDAVMQIDPARTVVAEAVAVAIGRTADRLVWVPARTQGGLSRELAGRRRAPS
jgi:hypothetical protein